MNGRPSSAADLRLRVLDAVRREPALPRPLAERRRAAWLALGFAGSGLIALARHLLEPKGGASPVAARSLWRAASLPGTDLPHRPLPFVVTLLLAWLVVTAFATWAGVTRGRSMLGRPFSVKLAVAVLTPLGLVLSWLLAARTELHTLDASPGALLHLHCALMSVAYALCPLVAFFAVRRGTDLLAPRAAGAAIGAVAGAWGALLYVVSCDCTSPLHIALAHVLPIALLAVTGALVGERVLGVEA